MQARGVQAVFELVELGEQMVRLRLRRDHSHLSEVEIEDRVRDWLRDRPGAPHGDAVGQPGHRFDSDR